MTLEQPLQAIPENVDGVKVVMLVDKDGMLVCRAGSSETDPEVVAVSYTDLARRIGRVHAEAELDPPSEMVIAGRKGAVLFQHVTEEFGLIAQLEPEATVGRVRYEMRKAASRLRPELEG